MKTKIPVQLGQKYNIQITGMGQSGEGVGRYENFTVFVPYALPGETVEAKITLVKKIMLRAKSYPLSKKLRNA